MLKHTIAITNTIIVIAGFTLTSFFLYKNPFKKSNFECYNGEEILFINNRELNEGK